MGVSTKFYASEWILMKLNHILYNEHAKYYDKIFEFDDKYNREVKFIDDLIKQGSLGNRIADFGCGTGNHLVRLEKLGYTLTGIDITNDMINIAKSKTDAKLIHGSMEDTKLDKQDVIICMWGAISHLQDESHLIQTLRNFYGNLKEGGVAIIDMRYSKKMKDYKIRFRAKDNTYLLSQWRDIKGMDAIYDYAYIVNNGDKIISNHAQLHQRFLNPFWFSNVLEKTGFKDVYIYEDWNLNTPYTEDSETHICPTVGFR